MNIFKSKILQGITVTVGGAAVLGIGAMLLKPFQEKQKEENETLKTVPVLEKKIDTISGHYADISCQLQELSTDFKEFSKAQKSMKIDLSSLNQKQIILINKMSKTDKVLLDRMNDIDNSVKNYKELINYAPPKYDTVRIIRDVRDYKIGVRKINEIIKYDFKLLADGE